MDRSRSQSPLYANITCIPQNEIIKIKGSSHKIVHLINQLLIFHSGHINYMLHVR